MAYINIQMNAIGAEAETCACCQKRFARGEQMSGVCSNDIDDTPLGWLCDNCISDWKHHGDESKTAKTLFAQAG